MQHEDEEPVTTFGGFTERWWTVYMLWVDLLMSLYEDLKKSLKALRDEVDLSWLDDAERMREQLRDHDRNYYPAA